MPRSKKSSKPSEADATDALARNWSKASIWQFSLLILALLLSIFIVWGRFDFGGRLPVEIYKFLAKLIGWLSWTALPALLAYLVILKFKALDRGLPLRRWLAALILLLSLAGILHVFLNQAEALAIAQQGRHGGYVGYGLVYILQYPFNEWGALLILVPSTLVSLFITLDASFVDFWRWLRAWWQPPEEEKTAAASPKRPEKLKLKKSVPLENKPQEKPAAEAPSRARALTAAADPDWKFPPLGLLTQKQDKADAGDVQANAETIRETLANFNIDVEMEGANIGPRVTQYTLKPPSGIKLSKILGLESNIALDLAASSIRIEAPIPGQKAVGIEVPNQKAATVRLSGLLATSQWQSVKPGSLAFCVGRDIAGEPEIAYLEQMPHLLLAGQTGSGKSVGINVLLTSLLYRNSPSDLKLILVDPKQVELGPYNHIPHLLTPVINTPEKCISALKWTVAEMERRLRTFAGVGKRNIAEYNELEDQEFMPFIVLVIDELADLMMVASRDVETLIVRIAQKARAAGIHLVLATQRPSVDVITGLIKANVPSRLAFTTASQVDSRTILDQVGAEKLLGSGDILYMNASMPKPKRLQGAFISDGETAKVCDFLRKQRAAQYDSEVVSQEVSLSSARAQVLSPDGADDQDELFKEAAEAVVKAGKASTSLLQRRLRIGYARAARLMEDLEEQGIIGEADGSRPRQVLRTDLEEIFGGEPADEESQIGVDMDDEEEAEEEEDEPPPEPAF